MGPLELPDLGIEPCAYPHGGSTIGARLVNPYASAIVLTRVPPIVHVNRPLEIAVAAASDNPGCVAGRVAASTTRCIITHARLSVIVQTHGLSRDYFHVPVSARPSDGGWIVRALVHPASWVDAVSITVVSLTLAGRPLPYDYLPTTLRVGYNHAPAPAGAVLEAAETGDSAALQAALDAGGSTEEADEVRRGKEFEGRRVPAHALPPLIPICASASMT